MVAKSYNIEVNNVNDTQTYTAKACMFMNRENRLNSALHMKSINDSIELSCLCACSATMTKKNQVFSK